MALAESRITPQGQVSIPDEIRRKLGVGPGSILSWEEEGGEIVVRKAKKYTSEDIRKALFPEGPPPRKGLKQMKKGIEDYFREGHARGRY